MSVIVNDYVLAMKYRDGDSGDHWTVGHYAGELPGGKHEVADSDGKRFGGFARVQKITPHRGELLLRLRDFIGQHQAPLGWWAKMSMRKLRELSERHGKSDTAQ